MSEELTLVSATFLLLLVTDPLGNVPVFLACLKEVEKRRHLPIIVREVFFAFLVLSAFLFLGRFILALLHLSESSLRLAGGILLFLISIRMLFPDKSGVFGELPAGEPFIFPLAVPLVAGPSAVATVLILAAREPQRLWLWFAAVSLCCAICAAVLCLAPVLLRVLGVRVLNALEKLMGLLLSAIAVEMVVAGIREVARL